MHRLVTAAWSPCEPAAQVALGATLGPLTALLDESSRAVGGAHDAESPEADPDLLVRLALEFDTESLSHALDEVFARHEVPEVGDSWLMPAPRRLGEAWQRGEGSVASERFVTARHI